MRAVVPCKITYKRKKKNKTIAQGQLSNDLLQRKIFQMYLSWRVPIIKLYVMD